MTIQKIVLFALFICLSIGLKAQIPLSSYYMENIPQSNLLNPALTPRANGFLAIPFANAYTSISSDLSTKDLFQKQGDAWRTPLNGEFDYSKLYKSIGKAANLDMNQTYAPLFFGFKGKRGYLTFGIIDKAEVNFALPKAFFQMVEKGIPNGSSFDFSTLNMDLTYYREISAGYTYQFSERLRIGAHAKLLFGLASINTEIEQLDLNIESEEWSYDLDATIYSSMPVDSITYKDDETVDEVYTPEINVNTILNSMVTNFDNPGFAFDIGAAYDLNAAWSFSASLIDLGMIKWNGNLNSFTTTGNFKFEGLDFTIDDLDNSDSDTSTIISDITDSIRNSIQLKHGEESFTTSTTPKMYLGAKYNVNHVIGVGFVSKSTFYKNNFQQEFGLSANFNLYNFLTTTISYNYALRGNNSLGLGLGLRGGPLQFYFVADYIPYNYRNYSIETEAEDGTVTTQNIPGPENLENLSLMFGFNLLFGASGFKDEPMIDAYSEF